VGSGIIETIIVVSAQIVVSHAGNTNHFLDRKHAKSVILELAQISSLVLLCIFLGTAVGQAIAGGQSIHSLASATLNQLYRHLHE
jgi:hypothetical protein